MNVGDYCRVRSMKGVACVYLGFKVEKVWDPECDSFELQVDEDVARVRMVGDDRTFEVAHDELIALEDEDFCAVCGQLGCGHGGR